MYSSEDLERFYFQYQTEAMPKGISIEQFCSRNKVPYNIFYKWYKDTRNKIVEVKVDGLPTSTQEEPKVESRSQEQSSTETKSSCVRILVVLLGPQVRYLEADFKNKLEGTNIPLAVIDMTAYGMMNGPKVLQQAIDLMK